ncbi:MAG: DUF4038 domain-containing protein [Acidobacteriaceae bacterium]
MPTKLSFSVFLAVLATLLPAVSFAAPKGVAFSSAPAQIEAYDYVEISATIESPDATDPFVDATFTGTFEATDGSSHGNITGFCDAADGSVFRIRFMPSQAGSYKYSVTYRQGTYQKTATGTFQTIDGHRKGMLRDDPQYPWHFLWEGTKEHYFFNGTTAYWLVGWRDEHTIQYSIDRLARLKVNRLRVTIAGRENIFFGEPVMAGPSWSLLPTAWPAEHPEDFTHPGFDYSRFYVSYWQKFDRMVKYARERDMIISVVFDMGDNAVHPVAGSEDEHRFIQYAVERYAAFSNVTWDLGDDLDHYRDEKWAHETGTLVEQWDPYHHLATSHPTQDVHQDRASSWFGFTSYQDWTRDQHRLMLESRKLQEAAGRIIPQTNEEYGYEDHYPGWAAPGSDSADVLRRTAWDIYMAGGYQTAGESARRGTNVWPDTGGGWMSGRGDDTQSMFVGYGHIVEFFSSFAWWKTNPHDELVNNGNYCLADVGKTYAIYLPRGGKTTVQLGPGTYRAEWFDANSGRRIPVTEDVMGPSWTSGDPPDDSQFRATHDWALLLQSK